MAVKPPIADTLDTILRRHPHPRHRRIIVVAERQADMEVAEAVMEVVAAAMDR